MISKIIFKLRSIFFKPNSKLELWLRTQYHRFNKTHLSFLINDWLSKRSYKSWRSGQKKSARGENQAFSHQPKISFIISRRTSDEQASLDTQESIQDLIGDSWEIIHYFPQSVTSTSVIGNQNQDQHIKVFPHNEKRLDELIEGDFVIFCKSGDQFSQELLTDFYKILEAENAADWYYFDCEYQDDRNGKIPPLFKPQSFSPDLLLSLNYISRGFIRTSIIKDFLRNKSIHKNLLDIEYELALHLYEAGRSIKHITNILVSQTNPVMPDTTERKKIIARHLNRLGLQDVKAEAKASGTRFVWKHSNPSIAIVIPTKNNEKLLSNCLASLREVTSYKNYQIHIVDNASDDLKTIQYYQTINSDPNIYIHHYPEKFNYSRVNNLGAAKSDSDLILFLNDDMEIFESDWLSELVQWVIRPEIGVVGTKLIRANHTIQHAGIIMGLNGFAGHIYLNSPEHYHGLFGSVDWYRDYLALTGACQMLRREVFNEVGGYDEGYEIAFGDIDFCIRVHESGYRNIYTPFAPVFHYEGQSRGYSTPHSDILRAYEMMETALSNEDPYFSPNLTYTRIPQCRTTDDQKQIIAQRKSFHTK